MIDLLQALLDSSGFIPHGHCYLWKPGLVWLHVISDSVIAGSYFSIPCSLLYFVSKRNDVPYKWIFLLFGAFIVACGTGHLMDVWTLWHPTYWLSGVIRAMTALISMITAIELIPVIPRVLALPSPAELEATNKNLEQALRELKEAQAQLIQNKIKLAKAETLQQSKDRFRSLLQNSSNIIATLKPNGKIDYVSPSLTHILGHQPDDWVTKNFTELVYLDDQIAAQEFLNHALQSPTLDVTAEFRLYHSNSSWRDFEAIAKNLINEPNVAGIVITYRDITERKQAEADMRQALSKERDLNGLKSRFISMASHEFRTPLAVMSSSIGILEDYGSRLDDDQRQKQFQHAQKSIYQITQLLDDLLTINRAEADKLVFNPAPFDIIQFCHSLTEEVQLSTPHHTIHLSVTEKRENSSGEWPYLDKKLLRRILTNLLSNATKYSPEGSTVLFELALEQTTVVLNIKDEGIGIPDEDQERLFEAFHRANNVGAIPGTGLGLAIVQKCVEQHNGSITVNSTVGAGTTFTISLPVKGAKNIPII